MEQKRLTYTNKELSGYLVGMFGQNLIQHCGNGSLFLFPKCYLPACYGTWLDNDNRQSMGRYKRPYDGHNR